MNDEQLGLILLPQAELEVRPFQIFLFALNLLQLLAQLSILPLNKR